MIKSIVKIVLPLFLDQVGRKAFSRRSKVTQLKDELTMEIARTNALIASLNFQGKQHLGISDERQTKISAALANLGRARD